MTDYIFWVSSCEWMIEVRVNMAVINYTEQYFCLVINVCAVLFFSFPSIADLSFSYSIHDCSRAQWKSYVSDKVW